MSQSAVTADGAISLLTIATRRCLSTSANAPVAADGRKFVYNVVVRCHSFQSFVESFMHTDTVSKSLYASQQSGSLAYAYNDFVQVAMSVERGLPLYCSF